MKPLSEYSYLIKELNKIIKEKVGTVKHEGRWLFRRYVSKPDEVILRWAPINFEREFTDVLDYLNISANREKEIQLKEVERISKKKQYQTIRLKLNELLSPPLLNYLRAKRASKVLGRFIKNVKAEAKPINYITWDVETEIIIPRHIIEEFESKDYTQLEAANILKPYAYTKPFLLCYEDLDTNTEYALTKKEGFRAFLEYIWEKAKSRTVILVAHNAAYDIKNLTPILEENKDLIKTHHLHLKEGDALITGYLEFYDGSRAWFNDTLLFFGTSLEEASGIKKSAVPYGICNLIIKGDKMIYWCFNNKRIRTYDWNKYLKYCYEDIRALKKIHKQKLEYIRLVNDLSGSYKDTTYLFNLTQSGLSKHYISELLSGRSGNPNVYRNLYRWSVDKKNYKRLTDSKIGGLASSCSIKEIKCEANEAIYKLDVTSEYPYIMTKGLPKGRWEDKPLKHWAKWTEWKLIRLLKVPKLKDCYKYSNFNSLIKAYILFNAKNNLKPEIYILSEYYNCLLELYTDFQECIEVINHKYQEIGFEFSGPYKHLYKLKEKLDKQLEDKYLTKEEKGEKLRARRIIKIILNGGYGKLMQKSYDEAKIFNGFEDFTIFNNINYESNLTGIYIATIGRVILIDAFLKCHKAGFKFLYCDTDSITFKCERNNKYIKEIFGDINTKKLGSWKLEGIYKTGYFWAAKKKYALIPVDDVEDHEKLKYARKGLAFGGVGLLPQALLYLYETNLEKFKEILNLLVNYNPIFVDNKNQTVKTLRYGQPLIVKSSIIWDSRRKPTHKLKIFRKGESYDIRELK